MNEPNQSKVEAPGVVTELQRLAHREKAGADAGGIPNIIEAHRAAQGAYETAAEIAEQVLAREHSLRAVQEVRAERAEEALRRVFSRFDAVLDSAGEVDYPAFLRQVRSEIAECVSAQPAVEGHRIEITFDEFELGPLLRLLHPKDGCDPGEGDPEKEPCWLADWLENADDPAGMLRGKVVVPVTAELDGDQPLFTVATLNQPVPGNGEGSGVDGMGAGWADSHHGAPEPGYDDA